MVNGKLEILRVIPAYKEDGIYKPAKYEVKCYCGNVFTANKYSIDKGIADKKGGTKSCGCSFKEMRKTQKPSLKHGIVVKNKRLYHIWHAMITRCTVDTCKAFPYYGGKGIKVCEEWQDVNNFYEWAINNGYADNLTLDRYPNNKGDYEPANCRWVDMKTQASNKSNTVTIEYKGESKNLTDWAKYLDIAYSVLYKRIKIWKLSVEEAFSVDAQKPYLNKNGYVFNKDIAPCLKIKIKSDGRKQNWLVKKLNNKGVYMDDSLFSLKLNGKDWFTIKELAVLNEIFGTDFK